MAHLNFPYGKKRNWELDTTDTDIGLKPVPDSLVVLQSLRQSRDQWLSNTFPKFTSKARGAKATESPPPHTIQARGKCDLAVGPHIFPDTTFYEVHYMQTSSVTPTLHMPSPAAVYPANTSTSTQPFVSTSPTVVQQATEQLKLSLGEGLEYTISSDLVSRIHYEASVNPIFADKFRLAVNPNATEDQIRNFAFALPSLPGVKATGVPSSLTLSMGDSAQAVQQHVPPVREWDIVIEFNELPNERWLIPRGTVASCTRMVNKDGITLPDASLTLRIPLPETKPKPATTEESTTTPESIPPYAAKYTMRKTPSLVYDLILRWIGGDEQNRQNAEILAKLPSRRKVYLAHRVAPGGLLTQLQAAQTTNYSFKPLKQGPSAPPRPRRKQPPKPKPPKPTPVNSTTVAATTVTTTSATIPTAIVTAPTATKVGKPTTQTSTSTSNRGPATQDSSKPKEPKRRRYQNHTVKHPPAPIRCLVCFKTDVPLMMGGRYCRECVDAGKANLAIPQLPRVPQTYTFSYSSSIQSQIPTSSVIVNPPTAISAVPVKAPPVVQPQPTTNATPVSTQLITSTSTSTSTSVANTKNVMSE